jgi:hypothetical protein
MLAPTDFLLIFISDEAAKDIVPQTPPMFPLGIVS